MNIEYIITGIVIIGVIILQVRSLIPTLTKIKNYKNIFPDDNTCKFGIDDSEIPIKRIRLERIKPESSTTLNMDGKDEKEGILTKIIDALNSYLSKNVGAANDFHLMKDVVERYCDAEVSIRPGAGSDCYKQWYFQPNVMCSHCYDSQFCRCVKYNADSMEV